MDFDWFEKAVQDLVRYIGQYQNAMQSRSINVLPDFDQIKPGYLRSLLPERAPEQPENFSEIMNDVREKIMSGVTHWRHPDFHAYFPTAFSYPSILGDLLSGVINCIGFSWVACPACTELEVIVLDWLVEALDLPGKFLSASHRQDPHHKGGGVIETCASVACATLIMGLRDQSLRERLHSQDHLNDEARLSGHGPGAILDKMVGYTSDQAHSSVVRAFCVAMIRYRTIPTRRVGNQLVFDAEDLRQAIKKDLDKGLIPVMCVATIGTTNTCEFDNLTDLGRVCQNFNLWFHVDAAYGGSALFCSEFRYLAKGLEYADSICINGHKMMMINFDCSFLWLKDHHVISDAFDINPTYLKHQFEGMPDYRKWSLSLGRRFRSLKVWIVLRTIGLEGIRAKMIKHHQLAKHFEQLIIKDQRFQITNDVRYGLVCFRLNNDNNLTVKLHDELLKDGSIFLVMGSYLDETKKEIKFLRFVCNHETNQPDVDLAYKKISQFTTHILHSSSSTTCPDKKSS